MTRLALAVALVGIVGAAVPGAGDVRHLGHSLLVAYLFYLSLALGSLFFVLLQFATNAFWSVVLRRLAEQVMGALPLFAVLFLPLAVFLPEIYPWTHPPTSVFAAAEAGKAVYLNPGFFSLRAFVYLLSWSMLAWWFRRESIRQDAAGDPAISERLHRASGPALVWFGFTVTFAAFDWVMSLDPHWYSTIFGVYFFSGCVVGMLALLIFLILVLQQAGLLPWVTAEHLHDLGKLLFAFVVFWAYIAFSQYLLIWYANIPEETHWYALRLQSGWEVVSALLVMGHFLLPFFLLLSRRAKRGRLTLWVASIWMLAAHYADLYWLVMPNRHATFQVALSDVAMLLTVGGLFCAWVVYLLQRSPLIPLRDPQLLRSLSFENP